MSDAEEVDQLQQQLAMHRRTLAVYLRQLANLGADYAPPGVHNGIADARAEIARLKVDLRNKGVAVDDQTNDIMSPAASPLTVEKPEATPVVETRYPHSRRMA